MEFPTWLSRILVAFLGCVALYFAAQAMNYPERVLSLLEKNIVARVGNTGLIIAWVLAAVGCFWAAYAMESDPQDKK